MTEQYSEEQNHRLAKHIRICLDPSPVGIAAKFNNVQWGQVRSIRSNWKELFEKANRIPTELELVILESPRPSVGVGRIPYNVIKEQFCVNMNIKRFRETIINNRKIKKRLIISIPQKAWMIINKLG